MNVKQVLFFFGHVWIVANVLWAQTEPLPAQSRSHSIPIPPEITTDGDVTLYTQEGDIGHTMPQIERHLDGSIYVNGKTSGLFKSTDEGASWERISWKYDPGGFGISRDGRIWLVTNTTKPQGPILLICQSSDGGRTWQEQKLDCGPLAKGGAADPYNRATPDQAYTNFIERPDGTWMFSSSMRYPDQENWDNEDQTRPGVRDVMVRTTDGGMTWGDPTIVHQHCTETEFAVDPHDPDHILAATRNQRRLLPGEDESDRVCSWGWEFKNSMLLDSTDGGRTFQMVPHSRSMCYGHRATILWTKEDIVVVTRQHGLRTRAERASRGRSGGWLVVNVSLDGGGTWVADEGTTTTRFDQARDFTLLPLLVGHGATSPTVQLEPNLFLTVYVTGPNPNLTNTIKGVRWRLGP